MKQRLKDVGLAIGALLLVTAMWLVVMRLFAGPTPPPHLPRYF